MTDQATTDAQANQQTPETSTAQSADVTQASTQQVVDKGTQDGADSGTLAGGGKDQASGDTADKGTLQSLRETLAGGDENLLRSLERYKSTDAISKAFKEARNAAKNAGKPVSISDKSTPEEVKAYREAYGIPDDVAAYPAEFRQDYKPTEADAAILPEFKAAMHSKNVPPAAAAAALEWYQDFATAQKQELDGKLAKTAKETQAALRSEWGGEYDGNLGAVRELMTTHLGADGFGDMMELRMMDGSRLQDHPGFVKMMAQVATDFYGSNAIFNGDIETTTKTIDQKLEEYRDMQLKDPEKYKSTAVQEEVAKLYAQKQKIDARKS